MAERLEAQIEQCMLADRPAFRRRLRKLRARSRDGAARERLAGEIGRSRERCAARLARLPKPELPPELPISAERERVAQAIAANPVTIVCGETGSGKTTQIPKICMSLGRGAAGLIGHTQPRRIAARSVAARIARELGTELGHAVGYQVRFTSRVSRDAYLKVMTDGILLAEIQRDRFLDAYDTIIVDEAHERSLNIDFLLGYLKRLLPKRPDLKLVITSATIDPQRFSRHFDDAPVVEVSGRSWPVEVRYRPLAHEDDDERERDMIEGIVAAADEMLPAVEGDVLVFLPGEREIRDAAEALRKRRYENTELLPLYARLSSRDQDRVFEPHPGRRIVLATNVAETSLTVPGIRGVIDSGLARLSRYSYRAKVQRLPIEKISQASAEQRKGRCGRIGPGICIRLYAEDDARARPEFTDPEIARTDLAAVILQMKALGLGDITEFPFIDAPDDRFVSDGYRLLRELGALDADNALTRVGARLARMPVDPRIGRMILAASEEGALPEVLIIAAALSIPDPRQRPLDAREAVDEAHARFRDGRSDFMAVLNLWREYHEQARQGSRNALRRWCQAHFLSPVRMREWVDVHRQLSDLGRELKLRASKRPASYTRIHRSLLSGLLGHIGIRDGEREYAGARNARFRISPGSGLADAGAKWVVAAELIETTQLYAFTAARIRPEWVVQAGAHLVRRSYFEPYWDARRAEVWAHERVTLYGLTLAARRRVPYAPVSPVEARGIFIQSALVEGRYDTDAPFARHNHALLAEIRALEHRARRADLLVDDRHIFEFYDQRVPREVRSGADFEAWRAKAERRDPECLWLERDFLLTDPAMLPTEADFPEALAVNGVRVPLAYRFEPGQEEDGVTATVPAAVLNQLDPAPFERLVPGLLREKVIALIRVLPKSLRRHCVPVPDVADACLSELGSEEGPLIEVLGRALQRRVGVEIPADAWRIDRLPEHLRMNFRVVDGEGSVLAQGRDLGALQRRLGAAAARSFARLPASGIERADVTEWDFGELPETADFEAGGARYTGYPALVDEGESVSLRVLDTPAAADAAHRRGLRRLFMRRLARETRHLRKNLPNLQQMCLAYALVPQCAGDGHASRRGEGRARDACTELREDLLGAAFDRAFLEGGAPGIRSARAFEARLEAGRDALVSVANELCALVERVLNEHRAVRALRREAPGGAHEKSLADLDTQLAHLVFRGFVADTPYSYLTELPRYLRAAGMRIRKLERDPARDASKAEAVGVLWRRYQARRRSHEQRGIRDPELAVYRWMLEELRVSFFAQELGTAHPVSVKRLEHQWTRVRP
ncbi:MAG: ATP-dependent RNA helicase HrpA [Gammaproteobacteria bacterium]|nr:ATP-dependent RNA helicase HrpA [Gammaproteobacteria bacterium]NIR85264.1 ATP-dependent RNA helicase HrpA [Gammaproteobacteria bacterium]NIR88380.1 ATP-dependent RNA helicase HrpA [Gammaproteobacteria bacterium]NIU06330.1 ATP-dependent RNA helicase HrpA [Gammaproteobacteria bacterium]NIV53229.1 ATP-dependent RNA helicase HrpA [Gammaproteobacteria bacterium]